MAKVQIKSEKITLFGGKFTPSRQKKNKFFCYALNLSYLCTLFLEKEKRNYEN